MADRELREAERETLLRGDDLDAAAAWLAATERAGEALERVRALSHLARLGDPAAHDTLCRLVPWPGPDGHGLSCRVRSDERQAWLEVVAADGELTVEKPKRGTNYQVVGRDGKRRFSAAGHVRLTPGPLAILSQEGVRLALRDRRRGKELANPGVPMTHHSFVVEGDRALLGPIVGGAVCIDLLGPEPGRVVWDSREPAEPAASIVPRPYDPGATLSEGHWIVHPKFGEGRVAKVLDRKKVLVAFAGQERGLAHGGRGEVAPAAVPVFRQKFCPVALAASLALLQSEEMVVALDARTGAFRWASGESTLGGADAEGVVLVLRPGARRDLETSALVELDPRSGEERWSFSGVDLKFLALGADEVLATRVTRKGSQDRDPELELLALERRREPRVRWRRPLDPVRVVLDPARVLIAFHPPLSLATGQDLPG